MGIIWSESQKAANIRRKYNFDMSIDGGGVDPTTGYTRRILTTMPWIDTDRPISLENIPDYTNWVAGIDSNMIKYEKKVYLKFIIYIILGILLIFLLIVGIKYIKGI